MLVPSLDESCLREIETYQFESRDDVSHEIVKRPLDPLSYMDLREYIWKRQARERTLVPVPAVKMDISNVALGNSGGNVGGASVGSWDDWGSDGSWNGCMPCNDADNGLIPSPWHEPSYGIPWSIVGGDLDAMGKGGKRELICHTCNGKGHPAFLCPRPPGAKDMVGLECPNCKGKNHALKYCPSPGGGKYNPPAARNGKGNKGAGKFGGKMGKGKGNKGGWWNGKGKGGGKGGASQYFKGKGS